MLILACIEGCQTYSDGPCEDTLQQSDIYQSGSSKDQDSGQCINFSARLDDIVSTILDSELTGNPRANQ